MKNHVVVVPHVQCMANGHLSGSHLKALEGRPILCHGLGGSYHIKAIIVVIIHCPNQCNDIGSLL
eukprot:scaffold10821_cov199-Amphora_coffeaeformis.AAC.11